MARAAPSVSSATMAQWASITAPGNISPLSTAKPSVPFAPAYCGITCASITAPGSHDQPAGQLPVPNCAHNSGANTAAALHRAGLTRGAVMRYHMRDMKTPAPAESETLAQSMLALTCACGALMLCLLMGAALC